MSTVGVAAPGSSESGGRRAVPSMSPLRTVALSLTIISVLAFCFLLTISVLGALRESRDQSTAYDDYRYELANGTAPVSQLTSTGQPVPLGTTVALIRFAQTAQEFVVVQGTTPAVLMSGPGHRRDTVLPGQPGISVIMGRRAAYGGPFAEIASLEVGSDITTVTGEGEATYRIVAVRRAGDPIPPAAQSGRLSLITAAGEPYRPDGLIIVDADLVSDALPADPLIPVLSALEPSERPLGNDSSAWFGLLLWGQALVLVSLITTVAWFRWGRWETWLIGVPIALAVGVAASAQASLLLPNLT